MTTATIKMFLPFGDARRLRTAEISNWSGKAIACPRTDLELLFARPEVGQSGVYLLLGTDAETGKPAAYIGEAEVLLDRLRKHRDRDFWSQVTVFFSKDENLTKAHIKYLEGQLIEQARMAQRAELQNDVASGARLPESDRADMEVFLSKIAQLLPVLGSDLLIPIEGVRGDRHDAEMLVCQIRDLVARGRRTATGFVVLKGSQAAGEDRPSAAERHRWVVQLRERLVQGGGLSRENGHLVFTRNEEFTSPSAAAGVIQGGGANGLIAWRDARGRTLKDIEGG